MRTDTDNFTVINERDYKQPRYVVVLSDQRIDETITSSHYFTSHSDAALPSGLSASDYTHAVLSELGGTSQKIAPIRAQSTIGSLSFKIQDSGSFLTTILSTENKRNRRAQVYVGYADLAWADYTLITTQVLDQSIIYENGAYTFKCSDVQRLTRKDIFDQKETYITAAVTATATTITVNTTTDFVMIAHGTSYSDAPSSTVGYFKIEEEIIRYTGTTSTTFTGCTRGVLNTLAAEHKYDSTKADDKKHIATEVIYYEMPLVKLILAILTGSLYNQAATIPAHHHCAIDSAYIQTADFTGVGEDYWDPTDDTKGFISRFVGLKKQDAKKFLLEQLYLLGGAFPKIYGNGSLGYTRMARILSNTSSVRELNKYNIQSIGPLTNDLTDVNNTFEILWSWSSTQKRYLRRNILWEPISQTAQGESKTKSLKFNGLHGSIHAETALLQVMNTLRDRYGAPPVLLQVTCFSSQNDLEVGDIINVNLSHLRDFTKIEGNRSYEIQEKKVDWHTGLVTFTLFGSSVDPATKSYSTSVTVVPDAYYTASGAELKNYLDTNYPGSTNLTGGILHIILNATLPGGSTLSAGTYYYDGPVTIDAGVTVTCTQNAYLKVKGFFQRDGILTLNAQGNAGAAASSATERHVNLGTPGYVGHVRSQGQFFASEYTYSGGTTFKSFIGSSYGGFTAANNIFGFPELNLVLNGNTIEGLPTDLRGTSGCSGRTSSSGPPLAADTFYTGGAGGTGGGGLCILSRGGANGVSGYIDLGGGDGVDPGIATIVHGTITAKLKRSSGAGGGPGTLLYLHDGTATKPVFTYGDAGSIKNKYGNSPNPYPPLTKSGLALIESDANIYSSHYHGSSPSVWNSGSDHGGIGKHLEAAGVRTYVLKDEVTPIDDINEFTSDVTFTLTEVKNTPKRSNPVSSIEVTITPPGDGNFNHANVYYRKSGVAGWSFAGGTAAEQVIVVEADGSTYEIMCRSVSIYDIESNTGPIDTITVSQITPAIDDPDTGTIVLVPNVRHLELFGQALTTEFGGKHAKFTWSKSNLNTTYEVGQEPQGLGSGAGALDLFFKDYQVDMYDDSGNLLRSENTTDNFYTYTFEKNVEDGGPFRTFEIRVYQHTTLNQISAMAAKLTVTNNAPALPTAIGITPGVFSIEINFDEPVDTDYAGMRVWLSTTNGFTPADTDIVYDGPGKPIVITNLPSGAQLASSTLYYIKYAPYDVFGRTGLNQSAQYSATTAQIQSGDVATIGGFEASATKLQSSDLKVGMDSSLKRIWINDTVYGNSGMQWEYNAGSPRFNMSDGADRGIKFDGTDLEILKDSKMYGTDAYKNDNVYYVYQSDTIDAWTASSSGNATYQIASGQTEVGAHQTGSYQYAERFYYRGTGALTWNKDRRLTFYLYFNKYTAVGTSSDLYFGSGYLIDFISNDECMLFNIDESYALYAINCDGTTKKTTDLSTTLAASTTYKFEIVFTAGTNIKYYVDDVLKATVTLNLPSGSANTAARIIGLRSQCTTGAVNEGLRMYINEIKFEQSP